MAALLSGHSQLDCGPETQLFNQIGRRRIAQAMADPNWPQLASALVGSVKLAGQRVIDLFQVSEDELVTYLRSQPPSAKTMLESLTATHAARSGKPRWIEKTPNHLLYLDIIRNSYPDSPVIRIVRDPRDSSASMCKLPWASKSVLANCLMWMNWFEASNNFFETDPNSLTVWYERLVDSPESELKRICLFIGETFEPQMLDTRHAGKAVVSPNESWKDTVSEPLNTSRAFAWRKELPANVAAAATLHCYPGIKALGYDADQTPSWTLPAYGLNRRAMECDEANIVVAALRGIRIINCRKPFRPGELLVLFYRQRSISRTYLRIIKISALLLARRLSGRKSFYLTAERPNRLRYFLWILAEPLETARLPSAPAA